MPTLPDANKPFAPFYQPVPVPGVGPFDAPTVTVCINETWMLYLIGAMQVLTAASTWDSNDPTVVETTIKNARLLQNAMQDLESCSVPIEFRPNPAQPVNWQYSLDAGTTWLDGPNTAVNFTPTFVASGAPGGYDESVNGGLSSAPIPLFTATDPDAVITDPGTLTRNLITASGSVEGLLIQALASLGVVLIKNNGVAAWFAKIPGLGLANEAVMQIAGGGDYTYPLFEVPDV